MVALVTSTLMLLLMAAGVVWVIKRVPADYQATWAECMVASVYVFGMMYLAYGTVPHQWLTWAENEQNWTSARLFDAWGLLTPISQGGWFPFDITYRVLSDSIAAIIYIVFLVGMAKLWGMWQNRGRSTSTAVVRSTYGRPLVKRG